MHKKMILTGLLFFASINGGNVFSKMILEKKVAAVPSKVKQGSSSKQPKNQQKPTIKSKKN